MKSPPLAFRLGRGRNSPKTFQAVATLADERARDLRKNATPAERALWRHLRLKKDHGWRFRRQHPLGPYYADFVCLEMKLTIEVDGGHHADGAQAAHDAMRERWLRAQGFDVLRFWNAEILRDPAAIVAQILEAMNAMDRR